MYKFIDKRTKNFCKLKKKKSKTLFGSLQESIISDFVSKTNLQYPCGYYCFLKRPFSLSFFFIFLGAVEGSLQKSTISDFSL